jgi:hypothetical protein
LDRAFIVLGEHEAVLMDRTSAGLGRAGEHLEGISNFSDA